MSDPSNPLRLEIVGVLRNGRRRYDPASKQRLVEACLQPGVSLAGLALQHGVNANLLRNGSLGSSGSKGLAWRQVRLTVRRKGSCRLSNYAMWLARRDCQLRLRSNTLCTGQRPRAARISLRQG